MTDITIPPEAERAVKDVLLFARGLNNPDWDKVATAACIAMLKAWPGMVKSKHYAGQGRPGFPCISLPLPTENSDE